MILLGTPVAFVVSLIGVIKDARKGHAIAGLIVSGAAAALMLVGLIQSFLR